MILIASGSYLQGDFPTEVGLLPPCFLPVGNKCLYEYQIELLKKQSGNDRIYLSLPESYKVREYDRARLNLLGVEFLRVPENLSLAESILFSWNSTGEHSESLTLLYGDSLFIDLTLTGDDFLSVHPNHGFYQRAFVDKHSANLSQLRDICSNDSELVVSGLFRFSDPSLLMKYIIQSKNDFITAVAAYDSNCKLSMCSDGVWLDFGHINSFFKSRTQITTEREFNDLTITERRINKSSLVKPKKIFAEGLWFDNLPLPLRIYTPALLGLARGNQYYSGANYQIQYLNLLPLSDLFVFTQLGAKHWGPIFRGISRMLSDFRQFPSSGSKVAALDSTHNLYLSKTVRRLEEFSLESGFKLSKEVADSEDGETFTLIKMAELTAKYISPCTSSENTISHGDLCFSNILYDARDESVKVIDPRGLDINDQFTVYGDFRYDVAKLYHSIAGLYDLIIAGRYNLEISGGSYYKIDFFQDDDLNEELIETFRRDILHRFGYSETEILAISIHLFLSMLPLHRDEPMRQNAFIGNAIRLFKKLRSSV